MNHPDVIILGGGAAGLMCAVAAAGRGRRVLVLERNDRIGEKIRISGGGRCNFTNTATRAEHYLSDNPHYAKSALARFTPDDFIRMIERHGIRYHEKTPGQLFCDRGSGEIISLFERECRSAGVMIVTGCDIREVIRRREFRVLTGTGEFTAASLVVATGGLSIPKLGATDLGYRIAEAFGLSVNDLRPGLVPLTLGGDDLVFASGLSGTSIDAAVSCGTTTFRGSILFTHRGLSGPAILQVSSYWRPGNTLTLDLCPGTDVDKLLAGRRTGRTTLPTVLADILPGRFAKSWCERFARPGPISGYADEELKRIAAGLHTWNTVPAGTEGFAKAEVTCGGVDTGGLSSKTMASKNVPGLYFIGEVVDVTGHLGGYNFQWAWSSGYAAGLRV